jgi:diacylglycerol kinase (ATP)
VPRALLIANPTAGRLRPPAVEAVLGVLRAAGWAVESALTTGPGDARRLAAQAVADGAEVVAVFGGDGTTMQAASALVGTGVALGVIPGGTGNVLAGNLRIPAAPARAARALLRGRPRPFDLGRVERPDGSHYFAVACGAGYDARVMAATLAEHKRRWGMAAYVATTLRLMPAIRCAAHRITVDGVEYAAEAAMVLVANCGEVIPPFIRLRAGIRPDDGVLDVVVLRANGLGQSVRAVWALLREAPELGGVPGALAAYARGREVRVEAEPVEPVQLDGDPAGETPFTAAVVPGAIAIIVPPA